MLVMVTAACGAGGAGGGTDGGVDAARDGGGDGGVDAIGCAGSWAEVATPARSGRLTGARGPMVVMRGVLSVDGGATWLPPIDPGPQDAGTIYGIEAMLEDPRAPDGLWVRSGLDVVYRWLGGAEFSPVPLGWPVAPDYVSGGELHGGCPGSLSCRLLRRAPGGGTTTLLDVGVAAIATFATDPQRIVVVTRGTPFGSLRASGDGGTTWSDVEGFAADAARTVVRGAGPLEIWAILADGTVARSTDGGDTWRRADRVGIRALVPDPTRPGVASGLATGRLLIETTDGGQTWREVATPAEVTGVAVGAHGLIAMTTIGLQRRDGDGAWSPFPMPAAATPIFQFVHAGAVLIASTSDGGDGATATWRSTDDGASWARIGSLFGIDVAPSDPAFLYASTPGGNVRSSDAGATWAAIPGAASIGAVGAHPELVYGAVPVGEGDSLVIRFARSRDGGDSFDSLPMPVDQLRSIRADPLDLDRVYLHGRSGSDGVVLRSDDQGASWSQIGQGWWTPAPDPSRPGRVWRLTAQALAYSDDAGDSWVVPSGAPAGPRRFVIAADGRAVVFTGDQQIWTFAPTAGWDRVGATPIEVEAAAPWSVPDGITIQEQFSGHLFLSRTLGCDR
jgi:photosystem II stability/assembly factor-like uncharacterized protein